MFLTAAQLKQLTGYSLPSKQTAWVKAAPLKEGKHYIIDPFTGYAVVFSWWCQGDTQPPEPVTEPDFSSLGQTQNTQQAFTAARLHQARQVPARLQRPALKVIRDAR